MYGKVLISVGEGLERGKVELERSVKISEGELVLLHVLAPIAETIGGDDRAELRKEREAAGERELGALISELTDIGRSFHTRIEFGDVAETIVKVADEENVDLIVMYTDGRDSLKDLLLGSITERVLRNLDVDLLAISGKLDKD